MSVKNCALCLSATEAESAEILTMGAYGTPKILCPECSRELNKLTLSKDVSKIREAMDNLTGKIDVANIDDPRTLSAIQEIFDGAVKRANAIKEGTYDFSLDESDENDGFADIPEELEETEEDRALDKRDAATLKKWDKIINWACIGVIIAAIGFAIYYFVS